MSVFQSTLSIKRETLSLFFADDHTFAISIHSLYKERDGKFLDAYNAFGISIHSLYKERDLAVEGEGLEYAMISIHSLYKERDSKVDT